MENLGNPKTSMTTVHAHQSFIVCSCGQEICHARNKQLDKYGEPF